MTPLYPLLLAGIMKGFGVYTFPSWLAAVSMNIGFSALTCLPLYYAGRGIGGKSLGAATAWAWALFPNAILLSFQSLWDASLSALLGATVIWATLRLADSARLRDWSLYGLLWGLVIMANAAVLSLFPFLLGWAAYRSRRAGSPWIRNTFTACLLTIACCVPWTLRNMAVMHSFVPLRSTLGLQLWVGNNPDANVVWLGEHHPIHESAERARYVEMGEIAYMAEKRRNAVSYMLSHPAHEIRLIAGRFVMLWSGGTPHPWDDFFATPSLWFRYVLLFNLLTAFGALWGMVVLMRRRNPYAFPLAAGPVVFPFAYYLTLALPRYRHPIDPVLILLTMIGMGSFFRKEDNRTAPSPIHGRQ
jgi:hypothetical protein